MMKKLILLTFLLTFTYTTAHAATDFRCVNDCTRRGYMYQFCVQNCSYDSAPAPYSPPPQQQMLTPMDIMRAGEEGRRAGQEAFRQQEEINAARIRNQQQQFDLQQQQEEAIKRQRILDLQLEEAEAKAAERRQKSQPTEKSIKDDN